jgi:hypothetical protein
MDWKPREVKPDSRSKKSWVPSKLQGVPVNQRIGFIVVVDRLILKINISEKI